MSSTVIMKKLFNAARAAQKNAYSPYSGFKIGASVLTENGKIFAGCNVENSSYGGTVCAERVAIFNAIQALGKIKIRAMVVISDSKTPWPPCGFCRQVISEFASSDTLIHLANTKGIKKTYRFEQLLPESFGPEFMK